MDRVTDTDVASISGNARSIPFFDPSRSLRLQSPELEAAQAEVFASGRLVLGPQLEAFEHEFADWLGIGYSIGCGSGTDALTLALLAGGVGPGDEVLTAPNTAFPTVTGILRTGASVRFCDVDPRDLLIDADHARARITPRTRAIVPVHLYGNPAPLAELRALCDDLGLWLVEDCAQAHGAAVEGKSVGTWGHCGAFSFYPTKNLGALGDGGAVVTDEPWVADRLRALRQHGIAGGQRDAFGEIGLCSRLDELQAAFLRVRLRHLDDGNARRQEIWQRYRAALGEHLSMIGPHPLDTRRTGAAHLAVARFPDARSRAGLRDHLTQRGIETLIHYPRCCHQQPALAPMLSGSDGFPVAEYATETILSLPCYPELTDAEQVTIIDSLREGLAQRFVATGCVA